MEQNGCENKTFRFLEVSLYIAVVIIAFMLAVIIYFIQDNIKQDDYCQLNRYDINDDGEVNVTDTLEIVDYILEH